MKLKQADMKWEKSKDRKVHLMNNTITKLKIKREKSNMYRRQNWDSYWDPQDKYKVI